MTSPGASRAWPRPASGTWAPHAPASSATETLRIVSRLAAEFPAVHWQTVDRQVRDTWNCAAHLGAEPTPDIVEELAREHLIALDGSLELIGPRGAGGDGTRPRGSGSL